jgi:dihydroorotate dehydrogenase
VNIYKFFKPIIFKLDPENAHNLAIKFLKFLPKFSSLLTIPQNYPSLHNRVCNIDFPNPIGMAAGFDKNAEIFSSLFNFGFGFVEVGTVTLQPQIGNSKPRIFRLSEDESLINRLGFNNLGAEYFAKNIAKYSTNSSQILGINIGKNKDTQDSSADYIRLIDKFYLSSKFITINISSPNTTNLRDLQNKDQIADFLEKIIAQKNHLKLLHKIDKPIFLKISPDLQFEEQKNIARVVQKYGIDALIIANSTVDRNADLRSKYRQETGGLTGKALYEKSNKILKNFYILTEGKIPLIGCGGVASAEQLYQKIKYGASLVQIYSAFIYQGFSLVEDFKKQLDYLLKKDGYQNIAQAIGCEAKNLEF